MDFHTLNEEYEHFFDIFERPPRPLRPYDYVYFMAFDAEWYQSGDRNIVLSYQIATVSWNASRNIIEFVPPGERLTLAEIVKLGVCSVNNGAIPDDHASARNLVVLISHSTVAEWSVLKDRNAPYITKQLTAIRKSPVTGIHPIEIILGDCACLCDVQLYDTRLIAPADFQSLKRLSTMLGSDDELKVNIGYHHIKRMDRLIKMDYPLYEKYALQDSEITLKLFFLLQTTLMELAQHDKKLYRTLASGAVTGFLQRAPSFPDYQKALKTRHFETAYQFIRSAYHGGRNEGFLVGRSDRIPDAKDRLWVDVDFVGCYPTAMALCPTIDCGVDPFSPRLKKRQREMVPLVAGEIKYRPLRYHLPVMSDSELGETGIKRAYYEKARSILDKITPDSDPAQQARVMAEFDQCLRAIDVKRDRNRLRDQALVFDNSLIDAWYERWNSIDENGDRTAERFIIPGFAKVRFKFSDETNYPCLPVSHPSYGLVYPLEGETFVTAPEIMLAIDAGAEIKALVSLELPVVMDEGHPVPRRLFFGHLSDLTKKRDDAKKTSKDKTKTPDKRQNAVVMERFIKEFVNSFYGKTAQAINFKKMHDPASGLMVELGPSPISEACTAALATGLPRSALSAVLLAIDQYNREKPRPEQIVVASATTDGLLVGLPRPEGVKAADFYEAVEKELIEPAVAGVAGRTSTTRCLEMKKNIPTVNEIFTTCGCGAVVPLIEAYLPIRQMRNSRRELTSQSDSPFLEIKHFADDVAGVKTRGQIGWVYFEGEKIVTIQAKFGLKPPVTDIIEMDNRLASIKALDGEYDRIMSAGGTAKATLECGWILDQIDRINNGEEEIFEYTFYGLKNFNEIIKGGDELDLIQTKDTRKFNADFDWKRKLIAEGGVVSPFSVPHRTLKEMLSYRGQVEKAHRRNEPATPAKVIQMERLKHTKTRSRGGESARLVRTFLSGMLFDHFPGGIKLASGKRGEMTYEQIVRRVNDVWTALDFQFKVNPPRTKRGEALPATPKPVKQSWTGVDLKHIARSDCWEEHVILPTARLEVLLQSLCLAFQVDYEPAQRLIFAAELKDKPDVNLLLQVVLAILKAPALKIEPFQRLSKMNLLPTRAELIKDHHPHLTEGLIASFDHTTFRKGQCLPTDKSELVRLFKRVGVRSAADAEACAQVLLPVKVNRDKLPKNPGQDRCVRLFAQALRMADIVNPPRNPSAIIELLGKFGLKRQQLYSGKNSKFRYHSISNTPENQGLIRKLAALFELDPAPFLHAMIDK